MSIEYICPSCKASVQHRIESIVMCKRCAPIALSFVDAVHNIEKIESDLGDFLNSATCEEMLKIPKPSSALIFLICHEARKLADGHNARMHTLMEHERSKASHELFDRLTRATAIQNRGAQTGDESGEVMR